MRLQVSIVIDSRLASTKLVCMDHIEFLREIGRKGGKKRLNHPDRKALAKHAARTRWSIPKTHADHKKKVYSDNK